MNVTDSRLSDRAPRFRQPLHWVRQGVLGACLGYTAGVLGYALLRPGLGDRKGWLELADDLEPWTYVPAPAIGLVGVALRSPLVAAAGSAMLATFGLRWGQRYLRSGAVTPSEPADLTIMTFNTLAWQREGHDLAASIERERPDVIGLQEIGPHAAEYLVSHFADAYPYHFVTRSPDSHGAAVLSRYPLHSPLEVRYSDRGHWWQRLTIETPRGPVTYLNVHTRIPYVRKTHRRVLGRQIPLAFHAERRSEEIGRLTEMLDSIEGPIVLGGDFNMTERSADYRQVAARLTDAYKAVGRGLGHTFPRRGAAPRTFPAPCPMLRLDYVWHSEHFQATWARRGDAGHSDHHPVIVGLRWAEPAMEQADGIPLAASAV